MLVGMIISSCGLVRLSSRRPIDPFDSIERFEKPLVVRSSKKDIAADFYHRDRKSEGERVVVVHMNVVDSSTTALCRTMMRDRRYSDVFLALQLIALLMSGRWCLVANGFSLATITITTRGDMSHPCWVSVGAGGKIEENNNSSRRRLHRLPPSSTALLLGSSLDETGNDDISSEASTSEDRRKKERSFKTSPSSITTTSTSFLPKLIVTCGATDELVEAIDEFVKPHHRVAEIGSQLRKVSTQICQNCQHATLVDVQRNFPKARRQDARRTGAMRLSPHDSEEDNKFFPDKSSFFEIAQLSEWPQALFSSQNHPHPHEQSYDILVLDVNAIVGNDLEWTSLQIIEQFHSYNSLLSSSSPEDLIVLVKSSGLNQWALRINHPKYWQDHQDDLWNFLKLPPFIVATVGVQEYRSTIQTTVRPTDFVLEVGCHYGTTTALLQEHAAHCMGVDVGSKIIAQAKKRHAHVDFRVGDAWKTGELLRFLQDYKDTNGVVVESGGSGGAVDVIYVDVGGLSGSDGLLEAIQLISSLRYALEPRCIVIKSLCMQRLSTRLTCFWQMKRKKRKALQEQS